MVASDLAYLQSVCQPSQPFTGGVDLAKLAKERHLVSNARCSLSDLCATILRKRLDKNVSERLSNQWESDTLTKEQVDYAARDAYVSLILYQEILRIPVPTPVPANPPAGLPVLIYHDDNTRLVAYGHIIKPTNVHEVHGAKISSQREIVCVTHVIVPGAVLKTHKRPLSSFGSLPFNIVAIRSHLRLSDNRQHPTPPIPHDPVPTPSASLPESERSIHHRLSPTTEDGDQTGRLDISSYELAPILDVLEEVHSESSGIPQHLDLSTFLADESDIIDGKRILGSIPSEWPGEMRSRVLKDPFHVFKMLYIPRGHGLRFEFAHALRDAIFIPNKEDKERIEAWATTLDPPLTFEKLKQMSSKRLWKHCRRIIPPPELLYPLVRQVFDTFGPLKDANSGQKLFNTSAWHTAKNILSLIHDGYLSDPPGISLYTQVGLDKAFGNLPIYRCLRGTNQTEGGVHTQLRPRLPTSGASIRHVNACLLDFILRHNLLVRLSPFSLVKYTNFIT